MYSFHTLCVILYESEVTNIYVCVYIHGISIIYLDIQQLIYCSVLLFTPISTPYLYMKFSFAQIFFIKASS